MLSLLCCAALVCLAAAEGPRPGFNNVPGGATRYAAFAILNAGAATLSPTVTQISKHSANPLFRGTEEWEHDINNGYSNVLYNDDGSSGGGSSGSSGSSGSGSRGDSTYRVYYSAGDAQFGGAIPGESSGSATLYATSRDGVTGWTKPHLGRFTYTGSSGVPSTANNILFDGTTAIAVYDDGFNAAAANASQRFKIWGNLPGLETGKGTGGGLLGYTAQLAGTAVSADGLTWTDYRRLQDPSSAAKVKGTWRFDAAANMYYDPKQRRYTGTMRAFRPCDTCGTCPIWWNAKGTYGCQAKLSDTCTAAQCNRTVRAIGASSSSAGDAFGSASWGPNEEVNADHDDPTRQFYSQVSWPYYNGYLGIVSIFAAGDAPNVYGKGKVHCELVWSADGARYERIAPGMDFVPLGSIDARDFDSHICFASAHPIKLANETRVYYFGGDGPHYSPAWPDPGHRNSSFGMGTLRPDGFVALRPSKAAAAGKATTVPLVASGAVLTVTADAAPGGSVGIMVRAPGLPGGAVRCAVLAGRNVTDMPLQGCDLSAVVGQLVTLEFDVRDAALYTVGFKRM